MTAYGIITFEIFCINIVEFIRFIILTNKGKNNGRIWLSMKTKKNSKVLFSPG